MPEIDPLAIVGTDEVGFEINQLGQHVNNPIEKTRRFMEEKGKVQKGKLAEGESMLPRLSEAQKQIATLGAGLVKYSLEMDEVKDDVAKMRQDLKTLRDVVSALSERLEETP